MPGEVSAGLMMYKFNDRKLKIFLVHPGGPYFKNKDNGYWSIPKGLIEKDEDYLKAAIREFKEETSFNVEEEYVSLGNIKQKSGKIVHAWAFNGNISDDNQIVSNKCDLEWPPRSGTHIQIPEVDDGKFFDIETAKIKINSAQVPLIERLLKHLNL